MADFLGNLGRAATGIAAGGESATAQFMQGMQELRQQEAFVANKKGADVDRLFKSFELFKNNPEAQDRIANQLMPQLGLDVDFAGNRKEITDLLISINKEADAIAKKSGPDAEVQFLEDQLAEIRTQFPSLVAPIEEARGKAEREAGIVGAGLTGLEAEQARGRVPVGIKGAAAKESILAKAGDITRFTKESLARAEKSGRLSDLEIRPESLQAAVTGKDKIKAEGDLRKEFTTLAKPFREIRDAFARVEESSKAESAAGDLALIFNFMKMLDPGSVVRESEFRTAEDAKAWLTRSEETGIVIPSSIKTAIQKAAPGEKGAFLLPQQRNDFVGRSKDLMKRQSAQHKKREKTFKGIANRNKLDVRNVVISLADPVFDVEEAPVLPEDIREVDIIETMRFNDMTRQQVLDKLTGGV
jgi:hypothetical protein